MCGFDDNEKNGSDAVESKSEFEEDNDNINSTNEKCRCVYCKKGKFRKNFQRHGETIKHNRILDFLLEIIVLNEKRI